MVHIANAASEDAHTALVDPLLPESPDDDFSDPSISSTDPSSLPSDSGQLYDGLRFQQSILIKFLYFLDALGSSTWGRFSAIYYNIHGLNSQQIGLIEGCMTSLPILSMVGWGVIADRFHCRKRVLILTKSVSTVILLLLALPYVYQSYARILVVSILAQLFVSRGILDAYTLDLLGSENKMFYGRYRLFASLSWGVGSVIIGWVTDHYSFDLNFVMFGVLSAVMIVLLTTQVPETSQVHPNVESADEVCTPGDLLAREEIVDLMWIALRPRVAAFLLEMIVMGAAMATVERLLFLYMVNDLNASNLLCGLSVGVNVLFELPIFWYASSIMNVLGHDGMFLLSMICFVVRVHGYTWLTPQTKEFILMLESMHGVTFATFWIVATDISKVLVESEGGNWSTTIPMSVQMLYSAVGVSLGSVLGGWAMHRYGSREMYNFIAFMVFFMMIVHVIGSIVARSFSNTTGSFLPILDKPSGNILQTDEQIVFTDIATKNGVIHGIDGAALLSSNGQDDNNEECQHLTTSDSLRERQDREIPGEQSRSTKNPRNSLSMLLFSLIAQSATSVSGFTASYRSKKHHRFYNGLRNHDISSENQYIMDIHGINDTVSKLTKRSSHSRKATSKAPVIKDDRWHWIDEADKVLVEWDGYETLSGPLKVSRLGFKVRGNPRPLQRHRTAKGHMYNPSGKFQTSFQNIVENLLFSKEFPRDETQQTASTSTILHAPIFGAEENLVMTIVFRMKRPKNHFVNGKPGPDRRKADAPLQTATTRTDVDNLTKFVLDSMNQVLYDDDRQVTSIHVTKLLDNDGLCNGSTEVHLRSMEESEIEDILKKSLRLMDKRES